MNNRNGLLDGGTIYPTPSEFCWRLDNVVRVKGCSFCGLTCTKNDKTSRGLRIHCLRDTCMTESAGGNTGKFLHSSISLTFDGISQNYSGIMLFKSNKTRNHDGKSAFNIISLCRVRVSLLCLQVQINCICSQKYLGNQILYKNEKYKLGKD